jgi:hypothetical protein
MDEIGPPFCSALSRVAGSMRVIFDQPQAGGSHSCPGRFRRLSGTGDAPVGYGANSVPARRVGAGGREAVGTFARLIPRRGLKNVPTHVEIIAELTAYHAGARTTATRRFHGNC